MLQHGMPVIPGNPHADAVKRIVRYLIGTKDKGLILHPHGHTFDCFVDASFADFDPETVAFDPSTSKSRTGYQVLYGGCPMVWASKLQKETCLSTTEAMTSESIMGQLGLLFIPFGNYSWNVLNNIVAKDDQFS